MNKKICELKLDEIKAVAGGVIAKPSSVSINVTATAMYQPAAQTTMPSRYEALLARR